MRVYREFPPKTSQRLGCLQSILGRLIFQFISLHESKITLINRIFSNLREKHDIFDKHKTLNQVLRYFSPSTISTKLILLSQRINLAIILSSLEIHNSQDEISHFFCLLRYWSLWFLLEKNHQISYLDKIVIFIGSFLISYSLISVFSSSSKSGGRLAQGLFDDRKKIKS